MLSQHIDRLGMSQAPSALFVCVYLSARTSSNQPNKTTAASFRNIVSQRHDSLSAAPQQQARLMSDPVTLRPLVVLHVRTALELYAAQEAVQQQPDSEVKVTVALPCEHEIGVRCCLCCVLPCGGGI